jgi:nicotinamide mononucleotide transporter
MDTLISQIAATSIIEWVATTSGLAAVYLSTKERILAWPLYILCYGLYTFMAFQANLFAAMVFNAGFIPFSIYGWRQWHVSNKSLQNNAGESPTVSVSKISHNQATGVITATALGTVIFGLLLDKFTEGAYPYVDAFATTLSFAAQWMLSRKYLENWIAWLVADLAFAYIWGMQGYWLTVLMFVIFSALAVKGYVNWRGSLMKAHYV